MKLIKKIYNYITKHNYPNEMDCPFCNYNFRYMKYSGMSMSFPHFYCNTCSNVIRRESDFDKVMKNKITVDLLNEITKSLPNCPCSGKFSPETNPKCPHCEHEIPHQRSAIERLTDPYLIVVQGAKLFQ